MSKLGQLESLVNFRKFNTCLEHISHSFRVNTEKQYAQNPKKITQIKIIKIR